MLLRKLVMQVIRTWPMLQVAAGKARLKPLPQMSGQLAYFGLVCSKG